MTIIANFSLNGMQPVLIGDIMLSRKYDGKGHKEYSTPLHTNTNYEKSDKIIDKLKQKLVLLSPRLAVAWTGDYLNASRAIELLRECYLPKDTCTPDNLVKFLNNMDNIQDISLTFVMIVHAEVSNVQVVRFSWPLNDEFITQKFGYVYSGGTGSKDFNNALKILENIDISSPTANVAENALISAMTFITLLSGEQMRVNKGIKEAYGGGFETIILDGLELVKIKDVTYHFWEALINKVNEVKIKKHRSVKYNYDNNNLIVHSLYYGSDFCPSIMERYIITPPGVELSNKENEKYQDMEFPNSLNAINDGFYIHFPQVNTPKIIVMQGNALNPPVHYVINKYGNADVEFSAELKNRILKGPHPEAYLSM